MFFLKRILIAFWLMIALMTCVVAKSHKVISGAVHNAGADAVFPVTSTILYTQDQAMLIDTQLTKKDAQKMVDEIKKSGKPLTLIYISHSDPDFYFGLETILKAYPSAQVIATPATVEVIKNTGREKLKYWQKFIGEQAPSRIVIPTAIVGNSFYFGKEEFQIKGKDPQRTYLWMPQQKMIIGGSLLSNNMFIWTADAPTSEQRKQWDSIVLDMKKLAPRITIPGHFLGADPIANEAIEFTHQYIQTYDDVLKNYHSFNEIIKQMKIHYPNLGGDLNLQISTKLILDKTKP